MLRFCSENRLTEGIGRVVGPKKAKLDEALDSLKEKQAMLAEAQAKLAELNMYLQKLQKEYEEKLEQKEELNRKVVFPCP